MTLPETHDDTQVLRSLYSLGTLEAMPEDRFARYTQLAARIFGVPQATVTFDDGHRRWFEEQCGLKAAGHHPAQSPWPLHCAAEQPIHAPDGRRVGALRLLDTKARDYSAHERQVLADLAALVDQELSLLVTSTIDELTQISNRRGFDRIAVKVLAHCQARKAPCCLLAIDLDGFKQINDQHGHLAGDAVLRGFAGLLLRQFRMSDAIARRGGDEFCVLAADTGMAEVHVGLERLAARFAASPLAITHPRLSWSTGIVQVDPALPVDLGTLLSLADERMYLAKHPDRRGTLSGGDGRRLGKLRA